MTAKGVTKGVTVGVTFPGVSKRPRNVPPPPLTEHRIPKERPVGRLIDAHSERTA